MSKNWRWEFEDGEFETHVVGSSTPNGPLWIGLHGFTGSGADLEPVLSHMASDTTWEAPDLPGHGGFCALAKNGRYCFELTDAMLAARLDKQGNRPVFLLGYSMGGRVALHFATRYSKQLAGVVLVGAHPGLRTLVARRERQIWERELCEMLLRGTMEKFTDYWQSLGVIQSQQRLPATLREPMLARRRRGNPAELAHHLRTMGTGSMDSLWESLKSIQCPLLYCAGEEDAKYRAIGQELVAELRSGSLRVISGKVGHAAHLEGMNEFCQAVLQWKTSL